MVPVCTLNPNLQPPDPTPSTPTPAQWPCTPRDLLLLASLSSRCPAGAHLALADPQGLHHPKPSTLDPYVHLALVDPLIQHHPKPFTLNPGP